MHGQNHIKASNMSRHGLRNLKGSGIKCGNECSEGKNLDGDFVAVIIV